MTTTQRTNWEAQKRAAHEVWNKIQVETVRAPGFYRKLSVTDKVRYHGRGCVYNRRYPDCWRIEWSSGKRSSGPRPKMQYNSMTVWGKYEEARALLDLIVDEPCRPLDEAKTIIEPYIEWHGSTRNGRGAKKRVIVGPIPASSFASPKELRRQQILLDYWRLRTIDTIQEYMRLGEDDD